jgi:hypothetical protein
LEGENKIYYRKMGKNHEHSSQEETEIAHEDVISIIIKKNP